MQGFCYIYQLLTNNVKICKIKLDKIKGLCYRMGMEKLIELERTKIVRMGATTPYAKLPTQMRKAFAQAINGAGDRYEIVYYRTSDSPDFIMKLEKKNRE